MEKKSQGLISIKKRKEKEITQKNEVNVNSNKSAGSLVYRNVSKDERKKIAKIAEEEAEKYGVLINIIEK